MPALPLLPRNLPRAFALLALSAACQIAVGSDRADAPAAKHAVAEEVAKEAAPKKPKAEPSRDPLDVIRERLAQKLGATKAPDTANPNAVRVVSKTSAPVAAEPEPAAEPKRPVHRKPASAEPARATAAARQRKPARPAENPCSPRPADAL